MTEIQEKTQLVIFNPRDGWIQRLKWHFQCSVSLCISYQSFLLCADFILGQSLFLWQKNLSWNTQPCIIFQLWFQKEREREGLPVPAFMYLILGKIVIGLVEVTCPTLSHPTWSRGQNSLSSQNHQFVSEFDGLSSRGRGEFLKRVHSGHMGLWNLRPGRKIWCYYWERQEEGCWARWRESGEEGWEGGRERKREGNLPQCFRRWKGGVIASLGMWAKVWLSCMWWCQHPCGCRHKGGLLLRGSECTSKLFSPLSTGDTMKGEENWNCQ